MNCIEFFVFFKFAIFFPEIIVNVNTPLIKYDVLYSIRGILKQEKISAVYFLTKKDMFRNRWIFNTLKKI